MSVHTCPNCKAESISLRAKLLTHAYGGVICSNCGNALKIPVLWNVVSLFPIVFAMAAISSFGLLREARWMVFAAAFVSYVLIHLYLSPLQKVNEDEATAKAGATSADQ